MITVFTPTYNRRKELENLYISLINQTENDFEWLIVDDGSSDDTKKFINKLIKENKINIKYVYKENGGKQSAYNRGLVEANGDIFLCIDSDDILEPTAVEHLHNEMIRTDRDVIMGYFYCQESNGDFVTMKEDRSTWLHGNIYRRSFLKKNNIKFCTGYNEDGAFNTQCYMLSDKIGIFQKPIMYWLHNKNSITRSQTEFSIRYSHHVVSTLNFAYQNIFSHSGRTKKTIKNMGTHWAMFYKLLNEIKEFDEDAFREVEDSLDIQIALFSKDLNIYNFTDHEKVYFKQGFTKGLQKYCLSDRPHWVTPETFLSMYSTGISLSVTDFLIGGE